MKIIVDSACDMTKAEAESKGLIFVPLTINFDGTIYEDGISITHEEFYQKLESTDALPVTSQVTPYAYSEAYDEAHRQDEDILVITLGSKLSGTYQSATIAAQEKDFPVHIVDTDNVCIGEKILVDYAIQLRDLGLSVTEIEEELNRMKTNVVVLACVDTLDYLVKGGRLSKVAGIAGTMLNIKPIIGIVDGKVAVLGKARGAKQSCSTLNKLIAKNGGADFKRPIQIAYSGTDKSKLDAYLENSKSIYEGHEDDLTLGTIGITIGTHVGPGAVGVAFFRNERK